MKRTALLGMMAAMFGGVVLAQQAPVPHAPAAVSAVPRVATNDASLWVELRDIQTKLHPFEENLAKNDPEVKALVQQRKDAEQLLQKLDKQRRDLVAAKLLADPAAAPLVKRRAELMTKAQELRSAVAPVLSGPNNPLTRGGAPASPAPAKTP